jgi:type II secretory pathway predicted ATPase ExeA
VIAEDAFSDTPQRRSYHATDPATTVLAQLEEGLAHALPLLVLSGVAGVGKSTVVREAAVHWGESAHVVWLELPGTVPDGLLPTAIWLFGDESPAGEGRPEQVARLGHALAAIAARGQTPVLVVDDAHALAPEMLAELGRIESAAAATQHTLKIVLVGEPGLDTQLENPELQSLASRVAVRAVLPPLSKDELRTYLDARVAAAGGDGATVFSNKAVRALHGRSHGVPALVNAVAQAAITAARQAGLEEVNPDHVRAVRISMRDLPRSAAATTAAKPARPAPVRGATKRAAASAAAAKPAAAASPVPVPVPEPATAPPAAAALAPAPPPPVFAAPAPAAATPGRATSTPQPASAVPDTTVPPVVNSVSAQSAGAPPPPTEAELLEQSDLESSHPRVRDWVSRFTDGGPVRFGGLPPVQPHLVESAAPPVEEPPVPAAPVRVKPARPKNTPTPPQVIAAPVATAPVAPPPSAAVAPGPATKPGLPATQSAAVAPAALTPPAAAVTPTATTAPTAPVTPTAPAPAPPTAATPPRLTRSQRRKQHAINASRAARATAAAPRGSSAQTPVAVQSQAVPVAPAAPAIALGVAPESAAPAGPFLLSLRNNLARAPRHRTLLGVVVPTLLMVAMATAAIIYSTRGGFDPGERHESVQTISSAPAPAPVIAPPVFPTPVPPEAVSTELDGPDKDARYCLAVGTYLFEDRARIRCKKLTKRTGLKAWVDASRSGGSLSFRILVGGFKTEAQAERTADRLLARGIVTEALVESLPGARSRH